MRVYPPADFDREADARRRRVLFALVGLAALVGAALGLIAPGGAQ